MSKDERFEKLYRDYYSKLVRFFVTHGCGRDEAADHAQESLLRVYRNMEAFRDESSVATWIYTIARNLWLNEIRYWKIRGGRHRTRSLQDFESPESGELRIELPAPEPSPLEVLQQDEQMRRLRAAIEELPTQQRTCIRMRLIGGLKYREIAQVTGKSIETVKSLLHDAKARLRLRLEGELPDFDESDEETEP